MKIWTRSVLIVACFVFSTISSEILSQQPIPGQPPAQYRPPVQPGQPQPGQVPLRAPQAQATQQPPRNPNAPPQNQAQLAVLDQVLTLWEQNSEKIENLECEFYLWSENKAFKTTTQQRGVLKYAVPDRGLYHVKDELFVNQKGEQQWGPATNGEHWACNGSSIFQFVNSQKVLKEYKLPEHMRGKAIQQSPLPFIFGAKKQHLQQRYDFVWQGRDEKKQQITVEAYPRTRQDLANYQKVTLILNDQTFLPHALRIVLPNGEQTDHLFQNYKVNQAQSVWEKIGLQGNPFNPKAPSGWKKEIKDLSEPPQPRQVKKEDVSNSTVLKNLFKTSQPR